MNTAKKRWMDSDLELYRDNVRRFVQKEIAPHAEKWAKQQHIDREVWRKAGELGLLLADVPDDYGGSGGNYAHMAILFEELGYAGDRAFGAHVHAIAAHYILNLGTEEQKQKYLPKLASGEMIGAIAMSEPNAGSDLQGTRTRAVRDGDEYVINGSKIFISNGYLADLIVVVTKTDPEAGSKGVSLMLLEMQNTRFVLANLKAQAVMARAFVDECIQRMIDGELDTVTASIVKLNLSELECQVMDQCLQFFGGYGYMLEYPITQMYADARVQRIYGGTSEIMKEIIARSL